MAENDIPRNPRQALGPCLFMILLYVLWYNWKSPETVAGTLMGAGFIVLTWLVYMGSSYSGEGSKLHGLKPIIGRMPTIKKPDGHVHFRTKMTWTLTILIVYFAMTNVAIYGLGGETIDLFSQYRAILAGASGSLMHLGIGPIVTGSIIMQLFTGAKIINLNLQNPKDKEIYQGTQKVLVIVMIIVESVPQVFGFLEPSAAIVSDVGLTWARMTIITQLAIGSYLVFLMDESVSKWGIGSGISLFIAAGVSQAIFTGTLNWEPAPGSQTETPSGTFPMILWYLKNSSTSDLSNGGYEAMLLAPPNPLVALLGTLVVFFIVVYVESSRIELPLAHGKVRGARGRYPIRLIYASNIPVILMAALLANVNMFALLFWSHPTMSTWPIFGHNWRLGAFDTTDGSNPVPTMGLAYYVNRLAGLQDWFLPLVSPEKYGQYLGGHEPWQLVAHIIVYMGIMVLGSIVFAKFWIETTNMGPADVAKQIQGSGMQIPGFRRDPRIVEKVLERYIPTVTVFSGAMVGFLAAGADMIGTVGQSSGTGVLLTVGIMIRMYEQIGKEQMMEMHPVLRSFFGEE
ncbi:MAG: preprotein translocase subunit SecY [Marine Group III euryarchaeote CG-Epi2]|uniref:Protein translocase subunit SecY n=1 Tax=Marine Group III euryarchaeote CG-Epi2 TaxID=1888996 RepID=A0A1J5UDM8_9ARCH|nr:MAG: preprotein translocase subunit SecY [Marine Group III euryarchaeote CG-Epi2]OIR22414.1 MAG: preprotein translocase subunit SecY [Marine Group III euryarchaeote CG-Epi2]